MVGKKKKAEELEELSIDKIAEQIEEDKRQVKRSSVLMLSAFIALIALGIAWFVANHAVRGTSGSVSAQSDVPYKLASVGANRNDGGKLESLNPGTVEEHTVYYDTESKEEVEKSQEYHVGTADLAWYMDGQGTISPGANGKLEFYVIPQHDGGSSLNVYIDLKSYVFSERETGQGEVSESSATNVQKLVGGHILLFGGHDSQNGYYDWCYDTASGRNRIRVDAPEGGFQADVPCKVSVYWVWPKYFRNYIYDLKYDYGNLFKDIENNQDHKKMITFVNEKQELLFSEQNGISATVTGKEINESMESTTLNTCSQYYDQADEWIGKSTDFIYVNASLN